MSTTSTHSAKKKALVPNLRFKEFDEEWKVDKLESKVNSISSGKVKPQEDGNYLVYGSTGVIGKSMEYSHNGDYLLVARVGANAGLINRVKGKYAVTDNTLVIDLKEEVIVPFCEAFLIKFNLNKLIFGSGQPLITGGLLKSIDLIFPTLPEQQKIASFLSAIDEKIQQLTRKKELLEQYKKGVMQQLFMSELGFAGLEDDRIADDDTNPKILSSKKSKFRPLRFKDENGKAFPKWEEKKLGDVLDLQHGYQFRTTDFTNDGLAIIKISNVIGSSLNLDDVSYISLDRYEEFKRFEIHKGDILMSLTGNIGRVVEVDSMPFKLIQNYRVGKFVSYDPKYLLSKFAKHLLMSDEVFGRFGQLSNQSAQANFGKQDMDKISVTIPSPEEQNKIASYLTSLDTKIESVAAQIAQSQTFKKGLLQQMFV